MGTKIEKVRKVVHKDYSQDQILLVPLDIKSLFPSGHIVFIIDEIVNRLQMEVLNSYYKGGGGRTYHPKMLIKVWLYGYCEGIYTSRRLARALRENIGFMYLSGQQYPCFKTLSEFRGARMDGMIEDIFKELLELLVEEGYVDLENLYTDGSKWEANSNRHKCVWRSNTDRFKGQVEERIMGILDQIRELQEQEDAHYGSSDLGELGEGKSLTIVLDSETVNSHLVDIEELIRKKGLDKEKVKALNRCGKKLIQEQEKLKKYEEQEKILGKRNSYARTDEDATMLRMKDDRLLPAYNVQHTTSNQYIVNYTIAQNASDSPTLIPHLDKLEERLEGIEKPLELNLCADAGYGSEENYADLERRQIVAYVKYPLWYQEESGALAKKKFHRENWIYDEVSNTFTCPNDRKLVFTGESKRISENGFERILWNYACESCDNCPFATDCKKEEAVVRTVLFSPKGEQYKAQAKALLASDKGREMRSDRSIEVESVFGDIKHNHHHRRFILRGLQKVYIEYGLLAIAHNIRKLYCEKSGIWEAYYAQRASKKGEKRLKRA